MMKMTRHPSSRDRDRDRASRRVGTMATRAPSVDARSFARFDDDATREGTTTEDARVAEALTRVTTTSTRESGVDAKTRARATRDALDALARSAPRAGAGTRWGEEACGAIRRASAALARDDDDDDEGRGKASVEARGEAWESWCRAVVAWSATSESWGVGARVGVCETLTRAACRAGDDDAEDAASGDDGRDRSSYKPPHARDGDFDGGSSMDASKAARARAAACEAIAALAKASGKALHGAWTTMLPTSERQLREKSAYASVVKAIACDSSERVRAAAASAVVALLEGPASRQYLAIAERRESTTRASGSDASLPPGLSARVRSFSALSTTLGDIVLTTQRALLRALSEEKSSQCAKELCKAIAAMCDAAPFDRFPQEILRETIDVVHAEIQRVREQVPNERLVRQRALFSALSSALSAQGATAALRGYLTTDPSSIIATMISHARGDASNSRCEAFGVLRALAVHHVATVVPISGRLRPLFPSAVCASGADDRACQASARLLVDYLGAVSGSDSVNDGVDDVDFVVAAKPSVLAPEDLRAAWTDAIGSELPSCASHKSALTRVAGLNALDRVNANVAACFESDTETLNALLSMPHRVLTSDAERVPAVRAAACRALGFIVSLPRVNLEDVASALLTASRDDSKSVKIPAVWSLANLCAVNIARRDGLSERTVVSLASALISSASERGDKVRANAVRGLGYLITISNFDDASQDWLHGAAQTLASCLTTGNAKTQWNACLGVAALLQNDSAMKAGAQWSDFIVRMLLLLIRDAKNFKIRLHAAAALGVGARKGCLSSTYADSVGVLTSSLELLENQNAALESQTATDFKYKAALVCQLTSTLVSVFTTVPTEGEASVCDSLKRTPVLLAAFQSARAYLYDVDDCKIDPRIRKGFKSATPAIDGDVFAVSLRNIIAMLGEKSDAFRHLEVNRS